MCRVLRLKSLQTNDLWHQGVINNKGLVIIWIGTSQVAQFSSVQSLSHVQLFATPWITADQASLSITNSWRALIWKSKYTSWTNQVILTGNKGWNQTSLDCKDIFLSTMEWINFLLKWKLTDALMFFLRQV